MGSNIIKPLNQEDFSFKIIEDLGLIFVTKNTKERKRYGLFECPICKNQIKMPVASAKKAKQCRKCRSTHNPSTHGDTYTKLYTIWKNMKARCLNSNHPQAKDYSERGITLCSDWKSFEVFKEWANNNGYQEKLSIDRINNDLGYYPDNCSFTTRVIQNRNKRKILNNNSSGYKGITKASKTTWQANISVNNKRIYLGTYPSKELAAKAYDNYIKENNLEHTTNE